MEGRWLWCEWVHIIEISTLSRTLVCFWCQMDLIVPGESKKGPTFKRQLLPEHIRNDILQQLMELPTCSIIRRIFPDWNRQLWSASVGIFLNLPFGTSQRCLKNYERVSLICLPHSNDYSVLWHFMSSQGIEKIFSLAWIPYSRGFHFSTTTKYMSASNCKHGWEENKGKPCLLLSLAFAGFWKGLSAENLSLWRKGMADWYRVICWT